MAIVLNNNNNTNNNANDQPAPLRVAIAADVGDFIKFSDTKDLANFRLLLENRGGNIPAHKAARKAFLEATPLSAPAADLIVLLKVFCSVQRIKLDSCLQFLANVLTTDLYTTAVKLRNTAATKKAKKEYDDKVAEHTADNTRTAAAAQDAQLGFSIGTPGPRGGGQITSPGPTAPPARTYTENEMIGVGAYIQTTRVRGESQQEVEDARTRFNSFRQLFGFCRSVGDLGQFLRDQNATNSNFVTNMVSLAEAARVSGSIDRDADEITGHINSTVATTAPNGYTFRSGPSYAALSSVEQGLVKKVIARITYLRNGSSPFSSPEETQTFIDLCHRVMAPCLNLQAHLSEDGSTTDGFQKQTRDTIEYLTEVLTQVAGNAASGIRLDRYAARLLKLVRDFFMAKDRQVDMLRDLKTDSMTSQVDGSVLAASVQILNGICVRIEIEINLSRNLSLPELVADIAPGALLQADSVHNLKRKYDQGVVMLIKCIIALGIVIEGKFAIRSLEDDDNDLACLVEKLGLWYANAGFVLQGNPLTGEAAAKNILKNHTGTEIKATESAGPSAIVNL